MNLDIKQLIQRGDSLLSSRGNLLSFWADVADNFYPERQQFTAGTTPGEDFAADLLSSYPLIVRRELSNAVAAMLRPRDQQWGTITVERDDLLDQSGKAWLEWATKVQWRHMYNRHAMFVRATKEGDADFVSFGQTVITREINWARAALLYRCWHLKDCAWAEDVTGQVDEMHINWMPKAKELVDAFPKTVHQNIVRMAEQEPYSEVKCRRIYVPADVYRPEKQLRKLPYTVVYVDVQNQTVLQEGGRQNRGYSCPRWQTVSGSPYAYSPAVVAALPDARLLQAMTLTLLEAGEMAVRPPVIGKQDLMRSDANIYAGGITWAHAAEDTRLQDVLAPIYQEKSGLPIGFDMLQDLRAQLADAFYLNKLGLPPVETKGEMTAYETAERLKEWIRSAMPLFEPMEQEYNGDVCEGTFDDLLHVGAFGPIEDIPESIRGEEVRFRFESPLHENIERKKAHIFLEAKELIREAIELDPSAAAIMDARGTLRDALTAIGVEAKRMRSEEEVEAIANAAADAAEAEEATQQIAGAGQAAEAVGKGQKALQSAA